MVNSKMAGGRGRGWWGGSSMDLISDRNPATFHPVTMGEMFFLGESCLLIYN